MNNYIKLIIYVIIMITCNTAAANTPDFNYLGKTYEQVKNLYKKNIKSESCKVGQWNEDNDTLSIICNTTGMRSDSVEFITAYGINDNLTVIGISHNYKFGRLHSAVLKSQAKKKYNQECVSDFSSGEYGHSFIWMINELGSPDVVNCNIFKKHDEDQKVTIQEIVSASIYESCSIIKSKYVATMHDLSRYSYRENNEDLGVYITIIDCNIVQMMKNRRKTGRYELPSK